MEKSDLSWVENPVNDDDDVDDAVRGRTRQQNDAASSKWIFPRHTFYAPGCHFHSLVALRRYGSVTDHRLIASPVYTCAQMIPDDIGEDIG